MCLLIQKPANVTFSEEWLRDFYTRNTDGYGVMYAENGVLHMEKGIGKVEDWIKFYKKHEHRECCIHLRMKTHGHIDLENCHPYPVFGFEGKKVKHPMLLMHNGVLSTGNEGDRTKSDTWHYVRNFLRPILEANPSIIHDPAFLKVFESHIGYGNKFALMDHTGKSVILNKSGGVEFQGAWLSNTYAWSHNKAFPAKAYSGYNYGSGYRGSTPTYTGPSQSYTDWLRERDKHNAKTPTKPHTVEQPLTHTLEADNDDIIAAVEVVLECAPAAYEAITTQQMTRLFKEFGQRDAWAFVEALEYSQVTPEEFVEGLKDPRKIRQWLNSPASKTFSGAFEDYYGGV